MSRVRLRASTRAIESGGPRAAGRDRPLYRIVMIDYTVRRAKTYIPAYINRGGVSRRLPLRHNN